MEALSVTVGAAWAAHGAAHGAATRTNATNAIAHRFTREMGPGCAQFIIASSVAVLG